MSSAQIDKLCVDWLKENYGEESASEYTPDSLVIPMWNPPHLNEALETLRQVLCIAFGPDQPLGTLDYHEARRKLGLMDHNIPIPKVFINAFTGTCEGS